MNCRLCEEVCPIGNLEPPQNQNAAEAAIIQHKDRKILRESTSGGAFTAIAECIIAKKGVVFGACLTEDNKVKHIYVESCDELHRFRNSKYVQSETGDSFTAAKRFLDQGRWVCFSGTPCQIQALSKFLRKGYEKLLLVDVVCRAVPSPGVWDRYVGMEERKLGRLESVRFRDKELGYQYSTMVLTAGGGKTERGGIESQPWLRMFFSGMIIRPSCTECKFRNPERCSDFTLWDCFNIHSIDKSFQEDFGTTRVLIHTMKGKAILDEIKKKTACKKVPFDIAVKGVKEMKESPSFHPRREEFYADYAEMEMEDLLDKYFPRTFSVRAKRLVRMCLNKAGLDKTIKHRINRG